MKPACPIFFRRMCLSSIAFISRLAPTGVWSSRLRKFLLFLFFFLFFSPPCRIWLHLWWRQDISINRRTHFLNVSCAFCSSAPLCIRGRLETCLKFAGVPWWPFSPPIILTWPHWRSGRASLWSGHWMDTVDVSCLIYPTAVTSFSCWPYLFLKISSSVIKS